MFIFSIIKAKFNFRLRILALHILKVKKCFDIFIFLLGNTEWTPERL